MKITKKIGFGALTLLTTTVAPLVTVVSCGDSNEDKTKKVETNIKNSTHKLIKGLFWNAKIEKHPSNKKGDVVIPINLNQKNEKIMMDYGTNEYDFIYNKLETTTLKNAFIILDNPSEGAKLIEEYKNDLDNLDNLGLSVRQLVEDIMPNLFNSINSFKYELTFKKKDGTTIKQKIDVTKEFKSRLEFTQYVTYATKMNIRKAELDNIKRDIDQSLWTVENSDRYDLSETYQEIEDSYQVLEKAKAKDAWMKLIKVREDMIQSHLGFAKLDIFKTKAKEENVDATSMIKDIFDIDKDKQNNANMKKEAEYKFR
ncbi:hypothetical protein [Mycoplasma todarodis]|uniref:Lipoprotein n=1 Tax=Mycoplasma todarodis TaxID=1937191 RepID=A0A4R0XVR0_9MOLU|nr:hypothetical protein [Mycoplasma todarodis]TCG11954.1 hypothetical protein C4B25_00420 [Mycoplasma todarodis]